MPGKRVGRNEEDKIESIEPTLQFCVFCDGVAEGPGDKTSFVGVFTSFRRVGTVPQFFIVLRWINGLGKHTTGIQILDPDLEAIYAPPEEHTIDLPHRANSATVNYSIMNFTFSKPGVHWVEVLLNSEPYVAIPVSVYATG